MYRRKSIVIVDDNPSQLALFKKAANSLDSDKQFHFVLLPEMDSSHILITYGKPLFVLCNANMQVIDPLGFFYRIIQANKRATDFIPVIFYGEDDGTGLIGQALLANVNGFFSRPSSEADSAALLRKSIDYWSTCVLT